MPFSTKFGTAVGVSNVPSIVWTGHAGAGETMPTSPGQIAIVSDSIEDAGGQTGVSSIRVSALTLVEVLGPEPGIEDKMVYVHGRFNVVMNGTSAATIVAPDPLLSDPSMGWRITYVTVGPSGSAGSNVGTISISIGGVVANEVRPGNGASESAILSIGGDQIATASRWFASLLDIAGQPTAQGVVRVFARSFGGSKIEAAAPLSLTQNHPADDHMLKHDLDLFSNVDYWAEISFVDNDPANFSAGIDFGVESRLRNHYIAAP